MQSKKTQKKETKKSVKPLKRKPVDDDDDLDEEDLENLKTPVDEEELEERLAEEMLGESDVEDDDEFIQEVEKFKKEHSNSKIIKVFKKLGNPKITDCHKIAPDQLRTELKKMIALLDEHNIIVHFHNDYTDKEKYRFITSEIFNEAVEVHSKHPVKFIYEDYHPEMDDEDEEEDF
jgi:hypothetical protein